MPHPTSNWRTLRRSTLPLALVGIGVMTLIGCIYIPATHALQVNGKLRPEHLVGKGKAIELGKTHIVDALIAVAGQTRNEKNGSGSNGLWPTVQALHLSNWYSVSSDRRQFAMSYQLRVGTAIWPLCFMAHPDSDGRYIVLTVNEQNIVIDKSTTDTLPRDRFFSSPPVETEVFSPDEIERLRAAGLQSTRERRRQQLQNPTTTAPNTSP